jgi:hypothetical protein
MLLLSQDFFRVGYKFPDQLELIASTAISAGENRRFDIAARNTRASRGTLIDILRNHRIQLLVKGFDAFFQASFHLVISSVCDIGRIGWAVPKPRELGDDSLNQLIIVVAKGSLHSLHLFEISKMLALGSDLRPLDLLGRWLGLLLRLLGRRLLRLLRFRLLRFLLRLRDGLTCQLG